jgi:elongator complex protein 1
MRISSLSPAFLSFLLGEAGKLLPHMLQFTDEHREEGKALQEALVGFQEELSKVIEEVWTRPLESALKDGAAMNGSQSATGVDIHPGGAEVSKPQIVELAWRVALWDKK